MGVSVGKFFNTVSNTLPKGNHNIHLIPNHPMSTVSNTLPKGNHNVDSTAGVKKGTVSNTLPKGNHNMLSIFQPAHLLLETLNRKVITTVFFLR